MPTAVLLGRPPLTPSRPTAVDPVAFLATDTGIKLALPFAPATGSVSGFADTFSTLPRPGRRPLIRRDGDGVPTMALDVLLANLDHQDPVEDLITTLRAIAFSGARVTVGGLSPTERGPWHIDNVTLNVDLRQAGTNQTTRATVSLTFIAADPAPKRVGPVTGGHKAPKGARTAGKPAPRPSTRYTVLKRGQSLWDVAREFYGDPNAWPKIAAASKIRNLANVPAGTRLTIPPLA